MRKNILTAIASVPALHTFWQTVVDARKYGAGGDEETNNGVAIQKAIDACSASGGQVLISGPFTFLPGPFDLFSERGKDRLSYFAHA
jgi:polygalacturonase